MQDDRARYYHPREDGILIVHVTQEDIALGERQDAFSCPIARATKRAFGWGTSVSVDGINVYYRKWWRPTYRYTGTLPAEALGFVLRFDMGGHVEPFSFEVKL